jgi:hypothetical protein
VSLNDFVGIHWTTLTNRFTKGSEPLYSLGPAPLYCLSSLVLKPPLTVGLKGVTTDAPRFLARRPNNPHQPTTEPTTGEAHPLVYGTPLAKVVPTFVSFDHGTPSGLEFVPTIHVV